MILGIDEVGRGCWAGPLVVGAVVLGDVKIEGLTDSKALSKKRREQLEVEIRSSGAGIGLGWVSAYEIDDIGLSEALRLATKRAVKEAQESGVPFHEIIIDGTVNFLSGTPLGNYVSVLKKADLLVSSVSAASIVAKVARDHYMAEQVVQYPDFGFEQHVGYGTKLHSESLQRFGITPLHRKSFAPIRDMVGFEVPSRDVAQTTRNIGDQSETRAAEYLRQQGYEILDRNWKTKMCEIDIVAKREGVYYFVEVKHRTTATHGDGITAITPQKLKQMKKAAELYALKHKLADVDLRLIAVATFGEPPKIGEILQIDEQN